MRGLDPRIQGRLPLGNHRRRRLDARLEAAEPPAFSARREARGEGYALGLREPASHRRLVGKASFARQRARFPLDDQLAHPERPGREYKLEGLFGPLNEMQRHNAAAAVRRLEVDRRLQLAAQSEREGVDEGDETGFSRKLGFIEAELARPRLLSRTLRLQIMLRGGRVGFGETMAVRIPSIDDAAMARNQQRDMHAPCG